MSELFLDWDGISFKEFRKIANNPRGKRSRGWMKNRLGHVRRAIWSGPVSRGWYRRWAGGRVHIRLEAPEIPVPCALLLRVYLDDDHARVDMDITRWSKGETINRLFDTKYKNGKIGHAGPWIPWFTLKAAPSRTIR